MRSTTKQPPGLELARLFGFAALDGAIVALLTWLLCRALPPLGDEPAIVALIPLPLLTVLVALPLHRLLRRLQSHVSRALALYGAFVVTLLLYGLYLGALEGYGSAAQHARLHQQWTSYLSLVPAALLLGHVFGMPVLVAVGLVNKLCSPWLTPCQRCSGDQIA